MSGLELPVSYLGFLGFVLVFLLVSGPVIALETYVLAWLTGPAVRVFGRRLGEGMEQGKRRFEERNGARPEEPEHSWQPPSGPASRIGVHEPLLRAEPGMSGASALRLGSLDAEHLEHDSPVYTYSAPGQPLCPRCGRLPVIFHCRTHRLSLCMECVGSHDVPEECVYVPGWRGEQSGVSAPPTPGPGAPPHKFKKGDVFGI